MPLRPATSFPAVVCSLALGLAGCGRPAAPPPVPAPVGELLDAAPPAPPPPAPPPAATLTLPPESPVPPGHPHARPEPTTPEAPTVVDGFRVVPFFTLAGWRYPLTGFEDPHAAAADGGPAPSVEPPTEVSALDGTRVMVTGFALPIEFEDGRIRKLMLMRYVWGCCYGRPPRLEEWVLVTIRPDAPAEVIPSLKVRCFGTIEVGAEVERVPYPSLFRLDAERVAVTYEDD